MTIVPSEFRFEPGHVTKDGTEWLAGDFEELVLVLMNGGSIEQAASLLCRTGSVDDVRAKARRLGFVG